MVPRSDVFIESLEVRSLLSGASFVVQTDPVGTAVSGISNAPPFVVAGSNAYFLAADGSGVRLYRTDGTPTGTFAVSATTVSALISKPWVAASGGSIFFTGDGANLNGSQHPGLWRTDGTSNGTVLLRSFNQFGVGDPGEFADVNGTLFFVATDDSFGTCLWKSDGTAPGTVPVKSLTTFATANYMVNLAGTLLFVTSGANGTELWRSDGTDVGTVELKDVNPGASSSSPKNLFNQSGTVFFTASDATSGNELWKTDGTSSGTVLVRDINPGTASSSASNFTSVGSTLYFTATTAANGLEVWKTDGSAGGTTLVKDLVAGTGGLTPKALTAFNGKLYFQADSGLWSSDGTAGGTLLVQSCTPYAVLTNSTGPYMAAYNGALYFQASISAQAQGYELYKTDGTAPATLVMDINSATTGFNRDGSPANFCVVNGNLIFSGYTTTTGRELYVTDGTAGGSRLLRNLDPEFGTNRPTNLTAAGNYVYYVVTDQSRGSELGQSDGTTEGSRVRDIRPGVEGSQPTLFGEINGFMAFSANDGTNGNRIYFTDGTDAGTTVVPGLRVDSGERAWIGDWLYFVASPVSSSGDVELYRTDGTVGGTSRVADISPGTSGSTPTYLRNLNGLLYFFASSPGFGPELWKSDGTVSGTQLVKDIRPGAIGAAAVNVAAVAGKLFFTADNGVTGPEFWQSDGTTAGTVLVKDFNPGTTTSTFIAGEVAEINGVTVMQAGETNTGYELWKTDGTSAGTVLLKDIQPGFRGSSPRLFSAYGGRLYFAARTAAAGEELWTTDGTSAGTTLFKDLYPGQMDSAPSEFHVANGLLYFIATDSAKGRELWRTDGTVAGTLVVADVYAGASSSSPVSIARSGNTFFFGASEWTHGPSVWKYDLPVASTASDGSIDVWMSGDADQVELSYSTLSQQLTATVNGTTTQLPSDIGNGPPRVVLAGDVGGSDSITISSGPITLDPTNSLPQMSRVALSVLEDGDAALTRPTTLRSIIIDGTLVVSSQSADAAAMRTKTLTFGAAGKMDLFDGDLVITDTPKATIESYIATAYNGGGWDGPAGIFSFAASANSNFTTTLGVLSGAEFNALNGGQFNGVTPAATDVLVKYTYYGDVNFDGTTDGLDYIFIDNGFLTHATGWANGDVNYDGVVDGLDYIFIDNAFLGQGGPL